MAVCAQPRTHGRPADVFRLEEELMQGNGSMDEPPHHSKTLADVFEAQQPSCDTYIQLQPTLDVSSRIRTLSTTKAGRPHFLRLQH